MIPNNQLSVLPFYDTIDEQNHRKDYSQGDVFPLLVPYQEILPFQIIRDTNAALVGSIVATLKTLDGLTSYNITAELVAAGLAIHPYASEGYDVIFFPSTANLTTTTPDEGFHYIELYDGVKTRYSEVFSITKTYSDLLKIEFGDTENIEVTGGVLDFTNNFKYRVYLPTQVGFPNYEFEEKVTKRDGYNFVENQTSEKVYRFNFLAPEYLCDALRIVRMMDDVSITSKGKVYAADSFLITPKWEKGGYIASVDTEFQSDTVIKKIGAKYIPIDNTDPGANDANIFVGFVELPNPDETAIRNMPSYPPIVGDITKTLPYTLNQYQAVSYPSSFGDLTGIVNDSGFDLKNGYTKINHDFTFGSTVVNMNSYVFKKPIKYDPGSLVTKTFKF